MRKSMLAVLIAGAFVGVVATKRLNQAPAPTASPAVAGETANERALAQATAAHKPVVLSFRSNSCRPCVAMGEVLAELKPKYGERVAFVDVSLDDTTPDVKLIQQHQVRIKPTTVVLTKDGALADTHIGLWPAAELARRLDGLAGR